jgi:hypothetical protein
VNLFQCVAAYAIAPPRFEHCRKLESVLVDGALGAPLGVGRLYGFRAQVSILIKPDTHSRLKPDTQWHLKSDTYWHDKPDSDLSIRTPSSSK